MLNLLERWTGEDENNTYEDRTYENDSYIIEIEYENDKIYRMMISEKRVAGDYIPRIQRNLKTGDFEIQTTSYGAKSEAEILEVITGYQKALETVQEIKNIL